MNKNLYKYFNIILVNTINEFKNNINNPKILLFLMKAKNPP